MGETAREWASSVAVCTSLLFWHRVYSQAWCTAVLTQLHNTHLLHVMLHITAVGKSKLVTWLHMAARKHNLSKKERKDLNLEIQMDGFPKTWEEVDNMGVSLGKRFPITVAMLLNAKRAGLTGNAQHSRRDTSTTIDTIQHLSHGVMDHTAMLAVVL